MRKLLLGMCALLGFAASAQAEVQIIAFGQTSGTNTIVGTANGTDTATTIDAVNAAVDVTQLFGSVATSAFYNMSASSVGGVTTVGGALLQHYDGSFCVSSGPGCSGTIDLSGTFTDAAFGVNHGDQLSVNVANPPDTLSLSSTVIAAADLVPPSAFTLSFSNVTPALHQVGSTFGSFGASFSGVASSTVRAVPEPASIALFGVGLLGLVFATRYRKA